MVGHVVEREVEQSISPSAAPSQSTTQLPNTSSGAGLLLNSIYKQESNNSFPSQQDLLDERKLEVAVALSMLVGIFQVGSDNQAAAFLSFCTDTSKLWASPFGTSLQYKFVAFEEGVTFNMSVLDANFISWGLSTGSHREQGHFTSAAINIIITFQLWRSEPQMFGHWKWQFAVEPWYNKGTGKICLL